MNSKSLKIGGAVALAAALLLVHSQASAQTSPTYAGVTITQTGTLVSNTPTTPLAINGQSSCGVSFSGGTSVTVVPQGSSDPTSVGQPSTAAWVTASAIGSGSISYSGTTLGVAAAYPGGTAAFRLSPGTVVGTITYSITCGAGVAPGSSGGTGSNVNVVNTPNVIVQNASSFPSPQPLATDSNGNLLTSTTYQSNDVTGTLGALNATVGITLTKEAGVSLYVGGTYSGNVTFQGSPDCTHYTTMYNTPSNATPVASIIGATGQYVFSVGGLHCFQVIMVSYTSGTANIALHATLSPPVPGSNAGGGYSAVAITNPTNGSAALTGGPIDALTAPTGLYSTTFGEAFDGVNWDRVRKDTYAAGPLWMTNGGSVTAAIAAATSGPTIIKATAGRLARLLITTAGTSGTETFYDNASACSGTVIGVVQGATADTTAIAGRVTSVDLVAVNGITACGGTGSPAVTVGYF